MIAATHALNPSTNVQANSMIKPPAKVMFLLSLIVSAGKKLAMTAKMQDITPKSQIRSVANLMKQYLTDLLVLLSRLT
ncbi:hypothetical protein HanPI659440_Chr05g0217791 [Helianthus annuus]|nr:hypothetical protein HanPI659440_Chr05g0217791 [Helianthus annuus]